MSSFEDLLFAPRDFSGKVRLFPLPNLVLFPHVMQPLHIFEPRYRCLLEDALTTDRLIAMALLAPGWESDYEGRPTLCPMACLGRVTTYHRLEDGTYNMLLLGLQRVRMVREIEPRTLYREAEVCLCQDCYPVCPNPTGRVLQQQLRDAFVRVLPLLPEAQDQMDQLLATDIPLGVLTDVISFMLEIEIGYKEMLLSEVNVHRRAKMLLEHLEAITTAPAGSSCSASAFPPRFSVN
ncbi:MAG: LON peptidase substrate-binding domain-containing protein [Thermoguttaceae bacterium]|jgi:ATP-dependent Lon protease